MADVKENVQPPITLNGEAVTPEKLQEEKENLPKNQRIVEVTPGDHRRLTRMRD